MINHQHSLLNIAQVTDILYIYTEPIHLLALAFSNGQVENHILTSETDAQWQMPAKNKEEWHKEVCFATRSLFIC